jgi:serine/threonine protein kinase
LDSSSDEDYSDDEEEGEDGYRVGGYHPVSIGDKFNNSRYIVIEKLGWGHFSTVWRCYDVKRSTLENPEYVALKIQKSASHYKEAALDEIKLLNCVKTASQSKAALAEFGPNFDPCVVFLLDSFEHLGRNGNHVCMTFDILGENLLKVIKKYNYRGIPLSIVRDYVRQICVGMDFLHRHCQIIHTDLKPENILIASRGDPPDINYVKSIIGDKLTGGTGGKSKAKKSIKDKSVASTAAATIAVAAATGAGIGEVAAAGNGDGCQPLIGEGVDTNGAAKAALTLDQRKKLKKKLKKKRQLDRKKEDKKKGSRNGRRKARSGTGDSDHKRVSESSLDKSAKLEMMLMEQDSIPLAIKTASKKPQTLTAALENMTVDDIADDSDREIEERNLGVAPGKSSSSSSGANHLSHKGDADSHICGSKYVADHKGSNSSSYSNSSKLHLDDDDDVVGDFDHHHATSDAKSYYDRYNSNSNSSSDFKVSGLSKNKKQLSSNQKKSPLFDAHCEKIYNSLPTWIRPTVFSYLNFDLLEKVDTTFVDSTSASAGRSSAASTSFPRLIPLHDSRLEAAAAAAAANDDEEDVSVDKELLFGEALQISLAEFEAPAPIMEARISLVRRLASTQQ